MFSHILGCLWHAGLHAGFGSFSMAVPKKVIWAIVIAVIALIVSRELQQNTKSFSNSSVIKNTPRQEVFSFFMDPFKLTKLLPISFDIADLVKTKNDKGQDQISYMSQKDISIFGIYETTLSFPVTMTVLEPGASIDINILIIGLLNVTEHWRFADLADGGTIVTEFTEMTSYKSIVGLALHEIQKSHEILHQKIKSSLEKE